MKKYRRIEINAYRRRVTVVSGEWRGSDLFQAPSAETNHGVSIDDTDLCQPIPAQSPEGQLLLLEAMRSLEGRLSPETRAAICGFEAATDLTANQSVLFRRLQAFSQFIWPKSLRPHAKG